MSRIYELARTVDLVTVEKVSEGAKNRAFSTVLPTYWASCCQHATSQA